MNTCSVCAGLMATYALGVTTITHISIESVTCASAQAAVKGHIRDMWTIEFHSLVKSLDASYSEQRFLDFLRLESIVALLAALLTAEGLILSARAHLCTMYHELPDR